MSQQRNAKTAVPPLAEQKLYRACKIIFGPELAVSHDFLQYLQESGLKSAYRQRALETHPDRCPTQGEFVKRRMTMMFHTVQQAYEDLNDFLEDRKNGLYPYLSAPRKNKKQPESARADKAEQRKTSKKRTRRQRVVKPRPAEENERNFKTGNNQYGSLPPRKLLFGHYLYYSGLIDWQTLIRALVWQRSQQPRLGEIGRRLGWLNKKDILTIMRHRTRTRPFGRSAVELGVLSESQLKILLSQQKKYRKKIGGYFVEKNIMTSRQLGRLVEKCRRHNSRRPSSHLYPL